MIVKRFLPDEADDAKLRALHAFSRDIYLERSPHEPPLPLDVFVANLRNLPSDVEVPLWAVWDEAETTVVARLTMVIPHRAENKHLMDAHLLVAAGWRRRGIATRLLRLVLHRAQASSRGLLVLETHDSVPAGEAFLRRIGGRPALRAQTNELRLAEVDRSLLRSWIERAPELAAGFDLGFWEGAYPEERMDQIVAMQEAWNTQPKGELEVEDEHETRETLREREARMAVRGQTRWTCYVQESSTGAIAGFTEIILEAHQPSRVQQELTAVFPPYRERGIGRWLKAAMLEKILDELPAAEVVVTGNADENAPMLAINRQVGFRPVGGRTVWQLRTADLERYLAAAPNTRA